jgi:UDP-N-acetylmuramyl pentapeptide phosphotransferase/UDP-N-acetylglucosamine-1-phosphate transferase
MDGMDGLAALQAVGAALAVAIGLHLGAHDTLAVVPHTLAPAAMGFFIHNAPPAKIFMGDAGSTFIGFTFAGLALAGAAGTEPLPILTVPIALAPFLLDGTFTIFRRLSRGERIWRAHRSHLYQRAVVAGLSHHDVLIRYAAWIGCSTVASVIVATRGVRASGAAVAIVFGGLAAVVRWVRRIERSSTFR